MLSRYYINFLLFYVLNHIVIHFYLKDTNKRNTLGFCKKDLYYTINQKLYFDVQFLEEKTYFAM